MPVKLFISKVRRAAPSRTKDSSVARLQSGLVVGLESGRTGSRRQCGLAGVLAFIFVRLAVCSKLIQPLCHVNRISALLR